MALDYQPLYEDPDYYGEDAEGLLDQYQKELEQLALEEENAQGYYGA